MSKDEDQSLRDTIASAFTASEAAPAATPPAAEAAPPTGSPSSPDNATSKPPAPIDAPEPAAPVEGQPAAAAPEPAPDMPKMPPGYPGGDQAWSSLAPETRTWVKAREQHLQKFIHMNGEAAKFGGAMWNAVRPYEADLRRAGVHPAQVVQEAMNLNHTLVHGSQAEKAALIQRMAQNYGVDLASVAEQPQGAQVAPEVDEMRQTLRGLVQHLRGQEQQQVQAQYQQAVSTVDEFARDQSRKYMSDSRVTAVMADLIEMGKARDLQHAYDMAVWTQPDIRAVLLEQGAAQRAAQARTAASEATPRGGAPVAAVMTPTNDSLRGTIERAWSAHERTAA